MDLWAPRGRHLVIHRIFVQYVLARARGEYGRGLLRARRAGGAAPSRGLSRSRYARCSAGAHAFSGASQNVLPPSLALQRKHGSGAAITIGGFPMAIRSRTPSLFDRSARTTASVCSANAIVSRMPRPLPRPISKSGGRPTPSSRTVMRAVSPSPRVRPTHDVARLSIGIGVLGRIRDQLGNEQRDTDRSVGAHEDRLRARRTRLRNVASLRSDRRTHSTRYPPRSIFAICGLR